MYCMCRPVCQLGLTHSVPQALMWDLLWVQHLHLARSAAQYSLFAIRFFPHKTQVLQMGWQNKGELQSLILEHVWFEPSALLWEQLSYNSCVERAVLALSARCGLPAHCCFTPASKPLTSTVSNGYYNRRDGGINTLGLQMGIYQ